MDDETVLLLTNAGLENYREIFKRNKIGITEVADVKADQLSLLISPIGDQVRYNKAIDAHNAKGYQNIVENKMTDAVHPDQKKKAWYQIADQFNKHPQVTDKRTMKQLMNFWTSLKEKLRDQLTRERQSRMATGGGRERSLASIDPDVAALAPHVMQTVPALFSSNTSTSKLVDRRRSIAALASKQLNEMLKISRRK